MEKQKVIPFDYIPDVGSKTVSINGKHYLVANDAMYTFYQRSKGEFSPFFLAIRDEKKILGCRCTECGIVRIPPFVTTCPDCDFAPTELVEVGQVGRMNSTPPITYFATSMFLDMAPYGRGRVILDGADTAMSILVYTTTGILVPGLVKKDTKVKVVFKDNRVGEITDIFCVPTSELSPKQVAKRGLQESEIDWQASVEPGLPKATDRDTATYKEALKEIQTIAVEMKENERCRRAIAGWKRNILVKTTGGEFAIKIDDGDLKITEKKGKSPDLVMVCKDIKTLLDGLAYRGALTDSVIMKKLWINKNMEFTTVFKLDRMARFRAKRK
jgi:uncharacterized OB-fold protein